MKIGIIGSGVVGRAVGTGFIKQGDEVKISSRNPDKAEIKEWVQLNGVKASPGTFEDAASFGDIIALATSWDGTENAINMAGKSNFKNKIVIDITNPLDFSQGVPPKIAVDVHNSGGELIQKWLPEAKVVKTLNIVNNAHMANPRMPDGPPDMFLCGNDKEAKEKVKEILIKWGWPVADLGGIENSRYLEAMAMIWIVYGFSTQKWSHAFKLINK